MIKKLILLVLGFTLILTASACKNEPESSSVTANSSQNEGSVLTASDIENAKSSAKGLKGSQKTSGVYSPASSKNSQSTESASPVSSQISPVPVPKYDNSVRPRVVSSENPLFNFKNTNWSTIPNDLRPQASVVYDSAKVPSLNFDALEKSKVPVILQCENWNSWEKDIVLPLNELEALFKKHRNIIGVSAVEQGCGPLNEIQAKRLINLIKLCGKYGALFIWEDGAGNNLNNVFGMAGEHKDLFNTIKANKDYIIFINKMVSSMEHFLNQSLIMGWWLSDLCTAWGVNSEDFYWWESGFGPRFQDTKGWEYYGLESIGRSRYSIPEALIGQMVSLGMIQGGTVFSFENVDRVICNGDTLLPIFEKVIHPLHNLAQNGGIPTKAQVRSRIKAAYHADDWNSTNIRLPGEQLFRDLYGCNQYSDSFISEKKVSPEFIPYTGRYFNLPVIPTLGKAAAQKHFSKIYDSKTLPSDKKVQFDALYPQNAGGDSCVFTVANLALVSNPYENSNIKSNFSGVSVGSGKCKIGGTLEPHNYIYAKEDSGKLLLHVNNYTIDADTAVWNNPNFDALEFLKEYMKPDCKWAKTQRVTKITVSGLSQSAKITWTSGANVAKSGNANTTLTVTHNGPVDIWIEY